MYSTFQLLDQLCMLTKSKRKHISQASLASPTDFRTTRHLERHAYGSLERYGFCTSLKIGGPSPKLLMQEQIRRILSMLLLLLLLKILHDRVSYFLVLSTMLAHLTDLYLH